MVKVIVTHPTGNANVRAAVNGFQQENMLAGFNTTIATFPGKKLDIISNIGPLAEFRRRSYHPALQAYTKTAPTRELLRHVSQKFGWKKFLQHEKGIFCIDRITKELDQKVASGLGRAIKNGANAVYSYEDGAAFTFKTAKAANVRCFYDLPTGYWRTARKLLEIEKEKWPDWMDTMVGFRDSIEKLEQKDEELKLADEVIVASQFTAGTLADFPGDLPPVKIIPYGFPPANNARQYENAGYYKLRPLKLLFVGKLTQQKGLADLFAAMKGLEGEVELTLVGHKTGKCEVLEKELSKVKWIPSLPHDKILQIMREHDVLVFPSLFDGFGLVITEAMAQGTPVIASDRSAGPDLIEHGKNGWLMKGGDTVSLRNVLEEVLSNKEKISEIGIAAMNSAKKRPWNAYSSELCDSIKNFIYKQG